MDLLPDVTVGCELCLGARFLPEVLACQVDGLSIAAWLDLAVAEAAARLRASPALGRPLAGLVEVGLGYLRLGQEGPTLSAGELQRLQLARLLAAAGRGRAAVLLDEPSRGLGREDVDRLLATLRRLADAGHLVVVVEHDLALIAASDWVIDLGPEGGDEGGCLVVAGPPATVVACAASHTGQALAARSSA
jgi:excinuclease ABC subunit A